MNKKKIRKNLSSLLSLCLVLPLLACGNIAQENQQEIEKPPVQIVSEIKEASEVSEITESHFDLPSQVKASRVYALNVFRQFNEYNNEKTPEKNLIISPLSFEYIMAMLINGADTQSSEKIAQALHLPKVDIHGLNQAFSKNMQFHTQKASDDAKLLLANGVFVNKNYTINPAYQQQMKDLYQANIQRVDDNDADVINGWVNKQTQGRIKNVVSNPVSDTTLVNTVYFKGKWPDEFFEKRHTKERLFQGINGQKNTPTMYQSELTHYHEDENIQALYQPYKGGDYAILLLLPKGQTVKDLDQFINKLDEPYFTQILENTRFSKKDYLGALYLPKFETEYKNDQLLENSQRLLGVDLTKCLFPKIVNAELEVSKMLQIANITLNEEGTEAAAATAIMAETTAAPMKKLEPIHFVMDINHPFAYAILDKEGNIVFVGTIKDIAL